jgi:hypothetical protein
MLEVRRRRAKQAWMVSESRVHQKVEKGRCCSLEVERAFLLTESESDALNFFKLLQVSLITHVITLTFSLTSPMV